MTGQPLVSVIMPALNAGAFIEESLRSALNQSYPRLEVLVVDDGSTDNTADAARRLAAVDSRITVLQQPNSGASAARNTALANARGDLVAFLDADDAWLPDKLARQIDLLRQDSRADLLFSDYYLWDGERNLGVRYSKPEHFPEGNVGKKLVRWNLFGMSSVVVARERVQRAGGFDPGLTHGEEWDLWLRISECGLWARGLREPLMRYRIWSGNASRLTVQNAECIVRVLEKALARRQTNDMRRAYRQSLRIARGNLELAKARPLIESAPTMMPAAILRAWRHYPPRVKWLLWYLGVRWPGALGGTFFARAVHDKIRRKW